MSDQMREWIREHGAGDWPIELEISTPVGNQFLGTQGMWMRFEEDEDHNEKLSIVVQADSTFPPAVSVEDARARLGDLVTRAAASGQVTTIVKNGIPGAALVPLSLLPRLAGTP